MRKRKLSGNRAIVSALVLLLLGGSGSRIAGGGQSDPPPLSVAVYVRDFELSVASAATPDPPTSAYTDKPEEGLQLRSRQVQDDFGETLVEMLRKQGYSSSRKQGLPGNGILLEGVFAESDQKNRIRRALLGSGSPGPKLMLYVGIFDQKSASQPLYVEAPVQEPDPNYGPVITLNAYMPLAKYEIKKDIAEEDVRRICAQLAADLTALLQRSPAAVAQAKGNLSPRYTFYGAPKFAQANSQATRRKCAQLRRHGRDFCRPACPPKFWAIGKFGRNLESFSNRLRSLSLISNSRFPIESRSHTYCGNSPPE
jgi:hypothetical protein